MKYDRIYKTFKRTKTNTEFKELILCIRNKEVDVFYIDIQNPRIASLLWAWAVFLHEAGRDNGVTGKNRSPNHKLLFQL